MQTGMRSRMAIVRQQVRREFHVELHAPEQVRFADVLLAGMSDTDGSRADLVALSPRVQEGKVAGVAHHRSLPSCRRIPPFMERKLYRELHRHSRSQT